MIKILLKFSKEREDIDGTVTITDKKFSLYDAPASWGGISPSDIFEGFVLSKCKHCQELQLLKFVGVDAVFSHERQMGYEIQYISPIHAICRNCGIEDSEGEIEFWEYPEYETYIDGISLDEFKVDLKCTDYMELILNNMDLLDESSIKSIKEEILETQKIRDDIDNKKLEIEKLKSMLKNPKYKELDFQRFFERNYWMFGIDYIGIIPQKKISMEDIPDFLLERYDGFNDILDLKLPTPSLFRKIGNKLHPRDKLSKGCSQIDIYIGKSNENMEKIKKEIGKKLYRPKGILVIGRSNIDENDRLRQYNDDLRNVRIMTYDDIIIKAINLLNIVQLCKIKSID